MEEKLINEKMTIEDLKEYAGWHQREISVFVYPDGSVDVQDDPPSESSNQEQLIKEIVQKVLDERGEEKR